MKKLAIWGALLTTALSVMALVLVFGLDPTVEASPPHKPLKCAGYMIEVDVDVLPYGKSILKVTPPPWGPPIAINHVLVGTNGNDLLDVKVQDVADRSELSEPWLLVGLSGNDTLLGFDGDDAICGYDGNDVIKGGFGNDILRGGHGCDHLDGGPGRDTMDAGPGNDSGPGAGCADAGHDGSLPGGLWGYTGDDTMRGGRGRDYLSGGHELGIDGVTIVGPGNDDCDGGPGIDEVEGLAEGNPDCENTKFIP